MTEKLSGFQNLNVDVLIKLGGSLLNDLEKCKVLAHELSELGKQHNIVVFPGGGPIDNYIEKLDQDLHFPPVIHHNLCARAQDQTGLIFGSMCGVDNAKFFSSFTEMQKIFDDHSIAVMLPMQMIIQLNVFEQSWKITSDTMSAYFANLLSANKFAILTNVDGLYADSSSMTGKPLDAINASVLRSWSATCVDTCLCPFLLENNLTCKILNGYDVSSIHDWVKNTTDKGTTIHPQ